MRMVGDGAALAVRSEQLSDVAIAVTIFLCRAATAWQRCLHWTSGRLRALVRATHAALRRVPEWASVRANEE